MKPKKTIKRGLKIFTILCALLLVLSFIAACSLTYEARVTNESADLESPVEIGSVDFGTVAVSATTGYETFDDMGPHTIKIATVPSTSTPTLIFSPFAALFGGGSKKTVTVNGLNIDSVSVSDD